MSFSTFKRVVREIYNLTLEDYEFAILSKLFSDGIEIICHIAQIISCYYILSRRNGQKPSFDKIDIKDLCSIEKKCILTAKSDTEIHRYVQTKWSATYPMQAYQQIEARFIYINENNKCIRGKFLMWFFIEFLNSLISCCHELLPNRSQLQNMRMFSEKTAAIEIAPRSAIPVSLEKFIEETYIKYIKTT